MLRKFCFTLAILVGFAGSTLAQDKNTRFSFLAGYSGNEFQPNPTEAAEYASGVWFEANGTIGCRGRLCFGGTVNVRRTFDQTLDADYPTDPGPLPAAIIIKRDITTISVGPKISFAPVKQVRLYGAALFGSKNLKFNPVDGSDEYNQFNRRYQFGVDLELGHFVIRPFYYEKEFTKGLLASSTDSYGAGVGFRF